MILDQYELENIEDTLPQIENYFNFKFEDKELVNLKTLGDLYDLTKDKIKLLKVNDCTTQQAFYKLRNAIIITQNIDRRDVIPATLLKDIFPRKGRKIIVKRIEQVIGFELNLLVPPKFVVNSLLYTLLASIVGLFFIWQYALIGVVLTILSLWIAFKVGNELDSDTIGQLSEKMTKENYLKSRRNSNTFNDKEIDKLLTDWFSDVIDEYKVKRNTQFC